MSVLSTAAIQAAIAATVVKINLWVKTNGNRDITGAQENVILNELATVLVDISDSYANILTNGPMLYKGVIDCSGAPNYPAADAGHVYLVSVPGKIGGALGIDVEEESLVICKTNGSAAGTQAAVGANWDIVESTAPAPPEAASLTPYDNGFTYLANVPYYVSYVNNIYQFIGTADSTGNNPVDGAVGRWILASAGVGSVLSINVITARALMVAGGLRPNFWYYILNAHGGQASIFLRAQTVGTFDKVVYGTLHCTTNGINWSNTVTCTMDYTITASLDVVNKFYDSTRKNEVSGDFSQFDWGMNDCERNTVRNSTMAMGDGINPMATLPLVVGNTIENSSGISFTSAVGTRAVFGGNQFYNNSGTTILGINTQTILTETHGSCLINMTGNNSNVTSCKIYEAGITLSGAGSYANRCTIDMATINLTGTGAYIKNNDRIFNTAIDITATSAYIQNCPQIVHSNNVSDPITLSVPGAFIEGSTIIHSKPTLTPASGGNNVLPPSINQCRIEYGAVKLVGDTHIESSQITTGYANVDFTTYDAVVGVPLTVIGNWTSVRDNTLRGSINVEGATDILMDSYGLSFLGEVMLTSTTVPSTETIGTIENAANYHDIKFYSVDQLTVVFTNTVVGSAALGTMTMKDVVVLNRTIIGRTIGPDWIHFESDLINQGIFFEKNNAIYS